MRNRVDLSRLTTRPLLAWGAPWEANYPKALDEPGIRGKNSQLHKLRTQGLWALCVYLVGDRLSGFVRGKGKVGVSPL